MYVFIYNGQRTDNRRIFCDILIELYDPFLNDRSSVEGLNMYARVYVYTCQTRIISHLKALY